MSHLKRFYSAVEQLPGKPHTFRDLVQGGGGGGTAIRGGQQFADFYCTSIKTYICVDTEGAL